MLLPLWNAFHVLIVATMLQYHLILIHILLLAWMIVSIMANAGTLHAKIVLNRKRYSSSVLCVRPQIIIDLLMVNNWSDQKHPDCHQTRKITTAHEFNEVLDKIINPGTRTTISKRFVI